MYRVLLFDSLGGADFVNGTNNSLASCVAQFDMSTCRVYFFVGGIIRKGEQTLLSDSEK